MAKFHLYDIKGEYKLFEEDLIEDALKTKEWFKTKAEALENDVKKVFESIEDFTDDEILNEATRRGLLEPELADMGIEEIKAKYTIEELKSFGRELNLRFKTGFSKDDIINKIVTKLKE